MTYEELLSNCMQLNVHDRLRLIDQLWDSFHPEESPLHDEWEAELEPRVAELQSDSGQTLAWNKIRNEALARIDRDHSKHVH